MKTVLKVDGLFLVTQDPQQGTRYAYRDENGRHVFLLTVCDPIVAPDDTRGWMQTVLSRCTDGEAVTVLSSVRARTATGFGVQLFEVVVKRADQIKEARIVAIYEFLTYLALVEVAAETAELLLEHRRRTVDLLLSARPDWRGEEVVSLAELFEGLPAAADAGLRNSA